MLPNGFKVPIFHRLLHFRFTYLHHELIFQLRQITCQLQTLFHVFTGDSKFHQKAMSSFNSGDNGAFHLTPGIGVSQGPFELLQRNEKLILIFPEEPTACQKNGCDANCYRLSEDACFFLSRAFFMFLPHKAKSRFEGYDRGKSDCLNMVRLIHFFVGQSRRIRYNKK